MKDADAIAAAKRLRRRAEEMIRRDTGATGQVDAADLPLLVHDLQVHRVELELQNEELRAARHDTEAALAQFTNLFEFAPVGYLRLDDHGAISAINRAGARILGDAGARYLGRAFSDLVALEHRAALRAAVGEAQSQDALATCEVKLAASRAAPPTLRLSITVLRGPAAATLIAFEDVTDRLARAAKLAETEAALREAHRRKDEFLAMLSHELRNPLAPIQGSLYVLGRSAAGSESAALAREVLERQVGHLTRLVDDLLDANRITRGKIQLQRERLELGEVVRQTVDDRRVVHGAGGLTLETRFDPGLYWVDADRARVVQVIDNLVGNAEKFTPQGGRIVVSLRREGDMAVLRVVDNGVGFAPEVGSQLFEPFAQGPQTMDRSPGGLGLGLAMVKGLVELHGGTVRLTSPGPGRGAEAVVALPLREAAARAARAESRGGSRSRRVLVVEDNPDSARILREALAMAGHEVTLTHDGTTALQLVPLVRPEVVICDIGLPGIDGYAVARSLRARRDMAGAYLIALSGYAYPEDQQRAAEAGFDRHIAKPPRLRELLQIVADAPATVAPVRNRLPN